MQIISKISNNTESISMIKISDDRYEVTHKKGIYWDTDTFETLIEALTAFNKKSEIFEENK